MRYVFIYLITFYQKFLSPDQGIIPKYLGLSRKTCIFYPSCSEYSKQAFLKYGIIKGLYLTVKRVLRCNPWNTPRVDELL